MYLESPLLLINLLVRRGPMPCRGDWGAFGEMHLESLYSHESIAL